MNEGLKATLKLASQLFCFSRSWKSAMKDTAPLLILGIIRILSTSGVDYQVRNALVNV